MTKKKKPAMDVLGTLKALLRKDEGSSTAKMLVRGKLITCVVLSITSAFIDIVFFSGMSRSDYPFFSISVAAATVLSVMSIGFSLGKFFTATQLSVLNEMQARIKRMGYSWYKNFNKAKVKWHIVHKFLIGISVITSISLSTITIGNGVRNMELNIKSMTEDAQYLIELKNSQKTNNTDKKDLIVGSAASAIENEKKAAEEAENAKKYLNDYKMKRDQLEETDYEDADEKQKDLDALKSKYVKLIPMVTSKNIDYTTAIDIENYYKRQLTNTSSATKNLANYEEISNFNKSEIESTIKGLTVKEYTQPVKILDDKGKDTGNVRYELIQFTDENGNPVELDIAIGRLQKAIMAWQSDTGDAGPSSKVFQLLATYINAPPSAGGMGFSEVIMMILICLFGFVQEYLIYIFTPKSIISRKMISQFDEYMGEGFDANRFMLVTYKDYLDSGVMSTELFEQKAQKCVKQMGNTIDSIIEKYTHTGKKVIEFAEDKELTQLIKTAEEVMA